MAKLAKWHPLGPARLTPRLLRPPAPPPESLTRGRCEQAELTDFAGQLYYEQGAHADSSFGCYSTGLIWGILLLYAAFSLARRSRNKQGLNLLSLPVQKTRILLVWGYIFLALSVMAGAYFHAFDTNDPDHEHNFIWFTSICFLGLHASFSSTAVVAMHQIGDITRFRSLFYIGAMVSGPIFVYLVLNWDLPFAAAFSMGAAGPCVLVVWGIMLHGYKYNVWKDALNAVSGALLLLFALFVQVGNSDVCAQPCPEGCPFPLPNLNHNATFHLLACVALGPMVVGFLGICYELESPDGMPYFNLFARAYPRSVQPWTSRRQNDPGEQARLLEAKSSKGLFNVPSIPEVNRTAYDGAPVYEPVGPASPSWPGRS
jgi:hypothetical protein